MKRHITTLFLLILLAGFSVFVSINSKTRVVRSVITPTKLVIDSNSKNTNSNEIYCIENIESFSLELSEEALKQYSKQYNLTTSEIISLGYLAQDFAQNTLLNQKVKLYQ